MFYKLGQIVYHVPTKRIILYGGSVIKNGFAVIECYDEYLQPLTGIDLKDTAPLYNASTDKIARGSLHVDEVVGSISIKPEAKSYAIQKLREFALKTRIGVYKPVIKEREIDKVLV